MRDNAVGFHFDTYPRGREYTYMVVVTGSPWAWSDGKGAWSGPNGETVLSGALGNTNWSINTFGDPLSPLETGGGLSIDLIDEPTRATRLFFAPNYSGEYTRVTSDDSGSTITVEDSSIFSASQYVYRGLETILINTVPTSTTFTRTSVGASSPGSAHFGSLAKTVVVPGHGVGPRVTTSPTVHRGRYVSIWLGVVEDDGSVTSLGKIWAGRLSTAEFINSTIRLNVDSLLAFLKDDDWPRPLPSGHFGEDDVVVYVDSNNMFLHISYQSTVANGTDEGTFQLGYITYSGGTPSFNQTIPGDGWYSLGQIVRWVSDTIIWNMDASLGGTSEVYNNFSLAVAEEEDSRRVYYKNDTAVDIWCNPDVGILKKLLTFAVVAPGLTTNFYFPRRTSGDTAVFPRKGITLSQTATEVLYYPDDPSDPLTENGMYSSVSSAFVGFARIHAGDEFEIISFTGTGQDVEGRLTLTGVERGLGGTVARAWGTAEDGSASGEKVQITQIWMIDPGESRPVSEFLLPALLSAGGELTTDWDILGPRFGLGIPHEFVAIEEIEDTLGSLGLDDPRAFWISDAKKGKEDLASFLQTNGVHFVTRRFHVGTDGKETSRLAADWFGITIESNEMPVRSTTTRTLTDADRSAHTSVSTDFNERLIVNSVRLAPSFSFGRTAEELGGYVYAWAEDSIADYGNTKTLEIRPTAMYAVLSAGGQVYDQSFDIYTGLAAKIGSRWFGSFANGNYFLTMEGPHTGWRFQPGHHVRVTLTGVTSPEGDDSLTALPGKVMEAKYRHGSRPGVTLGIRLGYSDASELCPAMQATAVDGTGTSLTIQPYSFSSSYQRPPFSELYESGRGPVDSYWFDYDVHTADGSTLKVWCWEMGDYAGGEERTISSVTHGNASSSTVVLSSALSAGLQTAAGNGTLRLTYAVFPNASATAQKFAYVGSEAAVPTVNSGAEKAVRLL